MSLGILKSRLEYSLICPIVLFESYYSVVSYRMFCCIYSTSWQDILLSSAEVFPVFSSVLYIEMSYRVLVFPGKRFAGGISTTTANVWVSVAGKLRDSDRKWLPRNCYDFTFEVS